MARHQRILGALGVTALLFSALAIFSDTTPVSAQDGDQNTQESENAGQKGSYERLEPRTIEESVDAIDALIEAKWKEEDLRPSDQTSEHEWLRRMYIDLIGRAPSLAEIDAYFDMNMEGPARRDFLVDQLMEGEEFSRWWGYFWQQAMISNGGTMRNRGAPQFRNWLTEQVKINRPYNELVRELISTTAKVDLSDPENASPSGYYTAFMGDINNLTGNLSRAFLGVEIQCVQCHDDMLGEPWNQPDFRGMAAIFTSTRVTRVSRDRASEYYETWEIKDQKVAKVNERQRKRLEKQAENNPAVAERLQLMLADPTPLGEEALTGNSGDELRTAFADWIVKDSNPWFAKATVNRVWGHFMKRGIVDPVDDFNSINYPSNEKLLQYLANDFKANGYDLQRLIKVILRTRAYQLSSEINTSNKDDRLYYSRGFTRQLSALELLGSLFASTNVEGTLKAADARNIDRIKRQIAQQFTTTFEDDEGREMEAFTGTIPQALMMMNGEFIGTAASASPGGTLFSILRHAKTPEERVKRMYLAALTREPNSEEERTMLRYLKGEGDVVAAYEDVFWALLNSAEFLNNH